VSNTRRLLTGAGRSTGAAGGGGAQPTATMIFRCNEADHSVTGPQDSGTKGYHLGVCAEEG
jgi:hypothetical protein